MGKTTLAFLYILSIILISIAIPTPAIAQGFEPSVGQAGKDVIWVPTPYELVEKMLDMAELTADDYLVDLGSGDGRIVIAAAKRGANALGIEYNPEMVKLSEANAQKEGVSDKARFMEADIFQADFNRANVLTLYLLPHLNLQLRPKILNMRPGTRVVSHAFNMDDWSPDQTATLEERTAYLWIVPAQVEGTWFWDTDSGEAELEIKQNFQKIEGILRIDGEELPLRETSLEGDQIGFTVGDSQDTIEVFAGHVTDNAIEGLLKPGSAQAMKWSASRRISQ